MVDIHSHIVFGVDDGAKTIEDSVDMLRVAADAGTTDIVATPHADLRFRFSPQVVQERIAEMQDRMGDAIRIHRGCDFHLFFENIRSCLADRTPFTINGGRYLMVEFSEKSIPANIGDIFQQMLQRDITPVVTHPERNALLMKDPGRLAEWVRMGCLMQVTAQSFTGRFGKSAETSCRKLMDHRMVHFVASDAHDTEWRPPDMRESRKHVAAEYGEAVAQRLFDTHPRMTLTSQYIVCDEPETPRREKSWYKFWS
jgi:protein-tyrosine phosphatase